MLFYLMNKETGRFHFFLNLDTLYSGDGVKDLWHFDRVSAYFSDASQIFLMHKISLVFFWIGRLMH